MSSVFGRMPELTVLGSAAYIGWTERDRRCVRTRSRPLPSARNPKSHFQARGTPGTVARAHEVDVLERLERKIDAVVRKRIDGKASAL